MSKKISVKKQSKAYKSILSRLYVFIFAIAISAGLGYYILTLSSTMQSIYEISPDNSTYYSTETVNATNETKDSISRLKTSDNNTTAVDKSGRINPFN